MPLIDLQAQVPLPPHLSTPPRQCQKLCITCDFKQALKDTGMHSVMAIEYPLLHVPWPELAKHGFEAPLGQAVHRLEVPEFAK